MPHSVRSSLLPVHRASRRLFGRRDFLDVLGCMGESVSLVDARGVTLATGPRNEAMLGWTTDEVVGQSGFARIHPDDVHATTVLFAKLVGLRMQAETRYLHKSGA